MTLEIYKIYFRCALELVIVATGEIMELFEKFLIDLTRAHPQVTFLKDGWWNCLDSLLNRKFAGLAKYKAPPCGTLLKRLHSVHF